MGIRFLCPNGHKLNVKSFLAGKRGICPACDAKFLVPEASGGQAAAIEEDVLGSGDLSDRGYGEPPSPPAMPAEVSGLPQSVGAEPLPTEVWYVRTAAGDQYGPANVEVMRGWVVDGRVPVDSWVWRTGWPEWKTGGQAITFLNGPSAPAASLPVAPVPEIPASAPMPDIPLDAVTGPLPGSVDLKAKHRTSRRSRQERARKVTFFLGGLVLLLMAVLVVVLMKK